MTCTKAGVLIALMSAMAAVIGGCSDSGTTPARGTLGVVVFYYRPVNLIEARASHSYCGVEFLAKESAKEVRLSAKLVSVPQGHGACVSADVLHQVRISHPVGDRRVVTADSASPASIFDIGTRLHPPIADASQMPTLGGSVLAAEGGSNWMLGFRRPGATGLYLILSSPSTTGAGATAPRSARSYTVCGANLCWTERGVDYVIGSYGLGSTLTRDEAISLADRLVFG